MAAANGPVPAWPEGIPKHMTWDEYLAWDFEGIRAEWVDGEIVIVSPVRAQHQRLLQFLHRLLGAFVERRSLGEIFLAPMRMRLDEKPSGREPDFMFIAAGRADRVQETYVDGPADLVVEIVSPESEARDRSTKFLEYEAGGVTEYWLLDPLRHAAFFYLLGEDGRYHLEAVSPEGRYQSQVLEGLRLPVEWLWREPLPNVDWALAELDA
jgi:Uma2 family endonuclease